MVTGRYQGGDLRNDALDWGVIGGRLGGYWHSLGGMKVGYALDAVTDGGMFDV